MTQNAKYHIVQQVSILKFRLYYFPPTRTTYMRNVDFYSLTPWNRVLREKLTSSQLVKKFPAFYGIRMFITSLKNSATCPILSQTNPVHDSPFHCLKIQLNIIIPSDVYSISIVQQQSASILALLCPWYLFSKAEMSWWKCYRVLH